MFSNIVKFSRDGLPWLPPAFFQNTRLLIVSRGENKGRHDFDFENSIQAATPLKIVKVENLWCDSMYKLSVPSIQHSSIQSILFCWMILYKDMSSYNPKKLWYCLKFK